MAVKSRKSSGFVIYSHFRDNGFTAGMQSSEIGICKRGTVPFVKRRYVKEVPFFQIQYKRVRGCTSWRSLPV